MTTKSLCRKRMVMALAATALLLLACGGGGGGGGSDVAGFTPAAGGTAMTVDQDSVVKTAGLATFAHSVGSVMGSVGYLPLGENANPDSLPAESAFVRQIIQEIAASLQVGGYQSAGSARESGECAYGGRVNSNLQWDGPDDPTDYCQIVNLSGTIDMSDCAMDTDLRMSGRIQAQFSGPFCEPTAMQFTMTNYTYSEPGLELQSRSLTIQAHGLTWSGQLPYGSIYSSTSVMNGQAVGTIDGDSFAAAFSNYTEVSQQTNYYQYSLRVSGSITGPCLDGWAIVSTGTPILVDDNQDCPLDGQITITGDGASMDVIFYSDGSVMVDETLYDSCEDLDVSCPVP